MKQLCLMSIALAALTLQWPSQGSAWSLFEKKNAQVEKGNRALKKEDPEAALKQYEIAAARKPEEGNIALNEGIAHLHRGDLETARKALLRSIASKQPTDATASAYYNLGLTYHKDKPIPENLKQAQQSYIQALRAKPGFKEAAWNLEHVRRLKQEQQEKRQQEQQGEKNKQEQEQEKSKQEQSPKETSSENSEDKKEGSKEKSKPQTAPPKSPPDSKSDPKPQESKDLSASPPPASEQKVRSTLDAIQRGEQSLEKYRARIRGQRRRVEKDW